MFIAQQQGESDSYNVHYLKWAAAQAKTVGRDSGGILMYFAILGYSPF